MRWMAAFASTTLVVIVLTFLLWVRSSQPEGMTFLSDVLQWAVPDGAVLWIRRFQVGLIFGLWGLFRLIFQWTITYGKSQVEGAPRKDRFLDRLSNGIATLFHNPARWWLVPYLGLLTLAMGVIGTYIWVFDSSIITRSAWGLSSLFAATLGAMTLDVDEPERPLPSGEEDPASESLLEAPEI